MNANYASAVDGARAALQTVAVDQKLAPKLFRLACHDAFTFDKSTGTGGANGSIRTERELGHAGNEGLTDAMRAVEELKLQCPDVSYADLIQLAGVVALEVMGGPKVQFVAGRKDSRVSPPQGRLPLSPNQGPGELRKVFNRMGLIPSQWLALAGFHPLGLLWGQPDHVESSWDPALTAFDNSFFKALVSHLGPTVSAVSLVEDPELREIVELYANDQDAWKAAFAEAFAQVTLLGTNMQPAAGGSRAARLAAGRRSGGVAASSTVVTNGQLMTGAVVVAAVGVAVGYWLGRRRRLRLF